VEALVKVKLTFGAEVSCATVVAIFVELIGVNPATADPVSVAHPALDPKERVKAWTAAVKSAAGVPVPAET